MKLVLPLIFASLLAVVPIYAEAKTFENDRYTFTFPNGCKMEKTENRFSTANAELECNGDAGFQFESDSETSLSFGGSSDQDLIDSMESVLHSGYSNVDTVESGTDKYVINNKTAPYIIVTYDQEYTNFLGLPAESEPFVLMYIMIDIGGGEKVLGEYRNDEDSFDKQLPMAEKIFKSVEGLPNRSPIAEEAETSNTGTGDETFNNALSEFCNTDLSTKGAQDLCDELLGSK